MYDSFDVFLARNGYAVRTTVYPEPESAAYVDQELAQEIKRSGMIAPPSVLAGMQAEPEIQRVATVSRDRVLAEARRGLSLLKVMPPLSSRPGGVQGAWFSVSRCDVGWSADVESLEPAESQCCACRSRMPAPPKSHMYVFESEAGVLAWLGKHLPAIVTIEQGREATGQPDLTPADLGA